MNEIISFIAATLSGGLISAILIFKLTRYYQKKQELQTILTYFDYVETHLKGLELLLGDLIINVTNPIVDQQIKDDFAVACKLIEQAQSPTIKNYQSNLLPIHHDLFKNCASDFELYQKNIKKIQGWVASLSRVDMDYNNIIAVLQHLADLIATILSENKFYNFDTDIEKMSPTQKKRLVEHATAIQFQFSAQQNKCTGSQTVIQEILDRMSPLKVSFCNAYKKHIYIKNQETKL